MKKRPNLAAAAVVALLAVFVMTVTDAGEPGGGDRLRMVFPDGQSPGVSGLLSGGNHQAHSD
ncbi:MAG: hypothetical protein O3B31_09510 [Chloroflexi bacterium]|nr:hypothetical protein [Chloroflexota bacterium]MDA1003564.1 hypothetical protein [Chloroflexota bacterium]